MSEPGQFRRGLGFGAGFAVSWVLVIFIGIPLLFIGGCAVLLGGGASSVDHAVNTAKSDSSSPTLTAADHRVLEHRAMKDVRYHWAPTYRPVSARCTFKRIDTVGPDSWDYTCVTTATRKGRVVRFREVIPCFTRPPYPNTENCDTSGQTPARVRS